MDIRRIYSEDDGGSAANLPHWEPDAIALAGQTSQKRMESQLDIKTDLGYPDLESLLYMAPTILNRVKELRMAHGWTQEQLAQAARVSRQSINAIERDRYVPSLELALTFARIFACPTDEIFQLEKNA